MSEKKYPTATEMDYPAHTKNYSGFLTLLKWGTILAALATAFVVYVISN